MSKEASPLEKPLAYWKTWWGTDEVETVAKTLQAHIDPLKLPRGGMLLLSNEFNGETIKNHHVSTVAEALLLSYPFDRQPSAYLLGDAVIQLDRLWNGALMGGPQSSLVKEKLRRDNALAEGNKLKKLISYMRTSALKAENGKTPEVTYLKTLANKRDVKMKRSPSASTQSSASSSPCSFYSGTTLELGQLAFNSVSIIFLLYIFWGCDNNCLPDPFNNIPLQIQPAKARVDEVNIHYL